MPNLWAQCPADLSAVLPCGTQGSLWERVLSPLFAVLYMVRNYSGLKPAFFFLG